jgi:RNA polymerase-interacting CarD/CdnL/TRCF family regulator
MIQLELGGGLRVELPLEHAQARLRPLATESDLDRVREVLRAEQAVSSGTWLKRKKESLAKLNDGDPIGLAQIIRDNAPRDPARAANGAKAPRSLWERDLATRARGLLSTEIAFAREIEPEEANGWIDQQLSRGAGE